MVVAAVRKGLKRAEELAKKGQAQARKAAKKDKKARASNYGKYGKTPSKKKKRAKTKKAEEGARIGSGGKEEIKKPLTPREAFGKIKREMDSGKIKSRADISAEDEIQLIQSPGFVKQRNAIRNEGLTPKQVDAVRAGRRTTVGGVDVSLWGLINRRTGGEKDITGPKIKVGTLGYSAKGKEVGGMKFTKDDLADIKQPVSPRDERKVRKAEGGLMVDRQAKGKRVIDRQKRGPGFDLDKRRTPKVGSSNTGRTGRFGHSDYRGNK